MELSYWRSRWKKQKTGWHMEMVNPLLKLYWDRLDLSPGSTVLVPLCGKSLDMIWLAEQGFRVVGVEISEVAVQSFVREHPQAFEQTAEHSFERWQAGRLEIWQGNFFDIPAERFPECAAVYDKAAMTALPPRQRSEYATRLLEITGGHSQVMLQCFEYPQQEMTGPPFSVLFGEIESYFADYYKITLLHDTNRLQELNKFKRRGLDSHLYEKLYHLFPFKSRY